MGVGVAASSADSFVSQPSAEEKYLLTLATSEPL